MSPRADGGEFVHESMTLDEALYIEQLVRPTEERFREMFMVFRGLVSDKPDLREWAEEDLAMLDRAVTLSRRLRDGWEAVEAPSERLRAFHEEGCRAVRKYAEALTACYMAAEERDPEQVVRANRMVMEAHAESAKSAVTLAQAFDVELPR